MLAALRVAWRRLTLVRSARSRLALARQAPERSALRRVWPLRFRPLRFLPERLRECCMTSANRAVVSRSPAQASCTLAALAALVFAEPFAFLLCRLPPM